MRSPVRRLLILLFSAALLMGALAGSATGVLAKKPHSHAHIPDTRVAGINVDETTIPQLQRLMNRHRLSSVQLTQFYLHRIKKLNPLLNAVITISPTALADARKADKARRWGSRLPLLGIPVLLKDNVNTTGMPTTAGSWALAGSSPSDAFIVQRLRAAGAIILGKANLSEWANFRSAPSSSGWSGIGGQTNMPYVLDRNPCGSSSGSGVAAAADLATITVGTETDGSIVCPSGANADVGIKPTLGPAEPGRHRPDLRGAGHRRPDHAQRDRRRRHARRHDGHRPQRCRDGRPGRPRVHRLHPVPRPACPRRRPDRRLARGHLRPDRQPRRRSGPEPDDRDPAAQGGDHRRPGADPDRGRVRPGVRGPAVRVQERHRVVSRDLHGGGVSQDPPGPDRLQRGQPRPRGPVELGPVRGGRRRPAVGPIRPAPRPASWRHRRRRRPSTT